MLGYLQMRPNVQFETETELETIIYACYSKLITVFVLSSALIFYFVYYILEEEDYYQVSSKVQYAI